MKIGLFTHTSYPFTNGVSTSVEQLAKALRNHDHEVTLITNNYDNLKNDFTNCGNIKVVSIPLYYQKLRTPILINPALYKELNRKKFDIVHSHSDFGLAMVARTYAALHHTPLIHTYHCNYLGYAKENFGKRSPSFFHAPVKYYTQMLCKTTDRMIVPSLETKRLLEEDFKVNKQLDYVPNGVDLEKFNRKANTKELKEKLGIAEDDVILLSLCRLSKEKGIDNIISLLPRLKECPKLKLLIVGGGPDENHLKRMVLDLKLENVIFTGEIPFDQVQDYYQLGDAYIINSRAETQGLTVVEALSSSLPVICPDIPLYQEYITDCENGFLYENYEELLRIIKLSYHNPDILKPMRDKAKESSKQFSLEQSVKRIEDIYYEEHYKNTI